MKSLYLIPILALFYSCSSSKESAQLPLADIYQFQNSISEDLLRADLSVIAHDSLEGRDTPSIGLEKAARYLTKRYIEMGLTPGAENNSFEQYYNLAQQSIKQISFDLYHSTTKEVVSSSVADSENVAKFISLSGSTSSADGELVFAGYGMKNVGEGINHFPENASGKWFLIFYDRQLTNLEALQNEIDNNGVLGAILIMDPESVAGFETAASNRKSVFGQTGRVQLEYLMNSNSGIEAALNRIHPELALSVLGLDSLSTLTELSESIKSNPSAFAPRNLSHSLAQKSDWSTNSQQTSNVIAFIEGSDPLLKNEFVVLSSHYDHVGIGRPDSTGDALYNGADDDGSGTVASLSVAQAFMEAKKAGAAPKRSIVFLHVSGEEKGLLGSRFYSDHPTFSMENTVANINMDMVGRIDKENEGEEDYIYVIGGEIISSGLDSLLQVANAASVNLNLSKRYNDLNDPNQFYRRSDHWNFGRLGVPFIFFFNGVHADYHRPSDHVDKIEFEALTKRTKLIYMTTAMIANADTRPVVDNQEFIEITRAQARN